MGKIRPYVIVTVGCSLTILGIILWSRVQSKPIVPSNSIADVDSFTEISKAITDHDDARIMRRIREGARLNEVDPSTSDGFTALMLAVSERRDGLVKLLLEAGADARFASAITHTTALHCAAAAGNPDVITLLIARGAAIDAMDSRGMTALHVAATSGNEVVVDLLAKSGANVDAVCLSGTSLHLAFLGLASDTAATKVIASLIRKGADVNVLSPEKVSVLRTAVHANNTAAVQVLLENGAIVDQKAPDASTAIGEAASIENWQMVKLLLSHGADANGVDSGGKTPLHWAAWTLNVEAAELLLSRGARVDLLDSERQLRPLDYVNLAKGAAERRERLVRLLSVSNQ